MVQGLDHLWPADMSVVMTTITLMSETHPAVDLVPQAAAFYSIHNKAPWQLDFSLIDRCDLIEKALPENKLHQTSALIQHCNLVH